MLKTILTALTEVHERAKMLHGADAHIPINHLGTLLEVAKIAQSISEDNSYWWQEVGEVKAHNLRDVLAKLNQEHKE